MPPTRPSWARDRRFAVVVDAGSSGSRLQVYSWRDVRLQRQERERTSRGGARALPVVEKGTPPGSRQAWQLKVEPGLSALGETPERVDAYLDQLFAHARSVVPPAEFARTPVYVLATAGLRLLPDWQREALLARTCSYLINRTPFHVGSSQAACRQHVQVITGEQEGLLGWITANYLMDGFRFPANPNDPVAAAQPQSTYGFLDMGGASTQIAFEPSPAAMAQAQGARSGGGGGSGESGTPEDELTTISLRLLDGTDASPNVFVTTFLGFGTNQARARYAESLLPSVSTPGTPLAPAAAPGSTIAMTTKMEVLDPCIPVGLDDPQGTSNAVLRGNGSFDQCLTKLKPLLRKEAACARPPCLFHGVHVPPIDFSVNHFIGVSEYWYSSHDIFRLGGVYDWAGFQRAAHEYCATPWATLLSNYRAGKYASTVDEARVKMQCFKAAWMTTVLHEGIGLPRYVNGNGNGNGNDSSSEHPHVTHAALAQDKAEDKNLLFQSVNDVHGLSVSWTLGKAVLEAAGSIPPAPGAMLDAPVDVAGQVGDNAPGLGNWIPFWNYLTSKNRRPKASQPAHIPVSTPALAPTSALHSISTLTHPLHASAEASTVTIVHAPPAPSTVTIVHTPPPLTPAPAHTPLDAPPKIVPRAYSTSVLGFAAVVLLALVLALAWRIARMRPAARRHFFHARLAPWVPRSLRRKWGGRGGWARGPKWSWKWGRRRGSALSRARGSPRLVSAPLTGGTGTGAGAGSGRATPTAPPVIVWTSSARPRPPPDAPPHDTDSVSSAGAYLGTGASTTSRPLLAGGAVLRSGSATPTSSRPPSRPPSRGGGGGGGGGGVAVDHRMREEYARAHYAREHRLDPHPPLVSPQTPQTTHAPYPLHTARTPPTPFDAPAPAASASASTSAAHDTIALQPTAYSDAYADVPDGTRWRPP